MKNNQPADMTPTLRDVFAMAALNALAEPMSETRLVMSRLYWEMLASTSYLLADAMLRARQCDHETEPGYE